MNAEHGSLRHIGGIVFDVTVSEQHADDLEITEHPVEQGAAVHDHAYKKPVSVTISAGATDVGANEGHAREVYDKLLELQAAREPVEIITGKRLYKNMLVKSVSALTEEATENCLLVTAECQEVHLVSVQVTTVPPRARHKNPGATGATTDKGQKQPVRKSALKSAAG